MTSSAVAWGRRPQCGSTPSGGPVTRRPCSRRTSATSGLEGRVRRWASNDQTITFSGMVSRKRHDPEMLDVESPRWCPPGQGALLCGLPSSLRSSSLRPLPQCTPPGLLCPGGPGAAGWGRRLRSRAAATPEGCSSGRVGRRGPRRLSGLRGRSWEPPSGDDSRVLATLGAPRGPRGRTMDG